MKSIEEFKDCKLEISALKQITGFNAGSYCNKIEEEVIDGDLITFGDTYDDDGNLIGCWVELDGIRTDTSEFCG